MAFTEECLTSVLSFRDAQVRQRLTASVDIIARARFVARHLNNTWLSEEPVEAAFRDVRVVLEARLDRARRIPRPERVWEAAARDLDSYLGGLAERWEEIEAEADRQRAEMDEREEMESIARRHPRRTTAPAEEPGS